MDSIPYEILQLVASWLLPRYQCRLAMTSKYNYSYLYSYLLKWHARKVSLRVPKYHIINNNQCADSLIFTGDKVVIYKISLSSVIDELFSANFSSLKYTTVNFEILRDYTADYFEYNISSRETYLYVCELPIIQKYGKYLHKTMLLALVNLRSIPRLGYHICYIIMGFLDKPSIYNLKWYSELYLILGC